MIYMMLVNKHCRHLLAFNYQHRGERGDVRVCRCNNK
jgi:hypothetical protein